MSVDQVMRVAVVVVLGAWLGCGEPAAPPPDEGMVRPHQIAKIGEREIDVIVDNQKFTTLTPESLRAGVRLDELVTTQPYRTWSSITLEGGGRTSEWYEPANNYNGSIPLAFLDGDRGTVAMVDAGTLNRAGAEPRADGVEVIRIEITPAKRTSLDALTAGCQPPPEGENAPPPPPRRWRGQTHQFNIPMHWRNDLSVDLGPGPLGAKVGTLTQDAVEWTETCSYDLYRAKDRNGRRTVMARLRHTSGSCVDSVYELSCSGDRLALWGYYVPGQYVEQGALSAVK
ncbi:MAG: hypothetical protein SFX73_21590 [Kofleriaceae bacterium]|nr:hypothetical protein [Kofleriaceae bacterium]